MYTRQKLLSVSLHFVDIEYTISLWLRREALSLTYSLDAWLTTNMLVADAHYARTVQRFSLRINVQHAVVAIVHSYYNNSVGTNNHMIISLIVVSLFCF